MGFLANLLVRIGVDNSDLNGGMDKATRSVNKFAGDVESAGKRLTIGLTLPIAGLGLAAVKTAGEMEQTKVAFTTLMKSADLAGKHIDDLKKFALSTPFQFGELTKASRLMQAYGFAADDVVPKLRTIGNAVSALGGGSELLERVVRSVGEIGTRGKITGEQLRELSRAGIPALDAIAKKLGVSTAEAQKKITAGTVDAKTAMDGLLEYMNTRFAGGMEAQSKTVLGSWSNIKDKITFTLADIGQALLPIAKNVINDFLDPMLEKVKALADGFSKLPGPIQNTTLALGGFAAVFPLLMIGLGATVTNTIAVAGAFSKMWTVLAPVRALLIGPAGAVALIAGIGVAGYKAGEYLQNKFGSGVDAATESLKRLNAEGKKGLVEKLSHGGGAGGGESSWIMDSVIAGIATKSAAIVDIDKLLTDSGMKTMAQRRKDLEEAKVLYAEVVKEYGAGSVFAIEALAKLKAAQEALVPSLQKVKEGVSGSFAFGEKGLESSILVEQVRQLAAERQKFVAEVVSIGGLETFKADAARNVAAAIKMLSDAPKPEAAERMSGALADLLDPAQKLPDDLQDVANGLDAFGLAGKKTDIEFLQRNFDKLGKGLETGAVSVEQYTRAWIALVKAQDAAGIVVDPGAMREVIKLEKQYGGQLKETRRETRTIRQDTEQFFHSMSRGITGAFKQWKGFGQGIASVFKAMGESIFDILFSRLMKPVEDMFTDVITELFTKTATQAATTQAATAALNVGMVSSDAAVASAATFASISAIPIVGPAMAPGAAAAAYAQVMAMAPLAMFEKGGNVPEDMPAFLHKKEMVLPADLAEGMRKIIGRDGGSSTGGGATFDFRGAHFGQTSMGQVVRQLRLAGARI